MSAWTDWLADPFARRELLVEAYPLSGGAEVVRRLSTRGFRTRPGDPAGRQYYDPRLRGEPTFTRSMREAFGGRTEASWGALEIAAGDGALDGWLQDAWDGRRIVLRLGDPAWGYDQYQVILDGVMSHLEASDNAFKLHLRDRQALLDREVQETLLTTGPRAGEPAPLAYGNPLNITPVVTDAPNLVYKGHDGAMSGWSAVYDNGVALTPGSQYTADNANGEFTLLQSPAGTITADLQGAAPSGTWLTTAGQIVRDLVTRLGPLTDPDDLDTASFAALDAAAPAPLDLYIDRRRNLLDALDEVVRSVGGYYGFTRAGLFQVGLLTPPTGNPDMTLTRVEASAIKVDLGAIPRWRSRLGYERNWTVQPADRLAGAVSDERRAWLAEELRTATAEDASVQAIHLLAAAPDREDTLIHDAADASAEAARRQALHGVQREMLTVEAFAGPYQVSLGDEVRLYDTRYGLEGGGDFRVIGLTEYLLSNRIRLELWR